MAMPDEPNPDAFALCRDASPPREIYLYGICGVDYRLQLAAAPRAGSRTAITHETRAAGGAIVGAARALSAARCRVQLWAPHLGGDSNGRLVRSELLALENLQLHAPDDADGRIETPYRVLLESANNDAAILQRPSCGHAQSTAEGIYGTLKAENDHAPHLLALDDGADFGADLDVEGVESWLANWPHAPLFLKIGALDSLVCRFATRAAQVWLYAADSQLMLRDWSRRYPQTSVVFRNARNEMMSICNSVFQACDTTENRDDEGAMWAAQMLQFLK